MADENINPLMRFVDKYSLQSNYIPEQVLQDLSTLIVTRAKYAKMYRQLKGTGGEGSDDAAQVFLDAIEVCNQTICKLFAIPL